MLLNLFLQHLFFIVQPRSDRARVASDQAGELFVGHVFKEPQYKNLAMFQGQFVQRGVNVRGVFGGEFRAVVLRQVIFGFQGYLR